MIRFQCDSRMRKDVFKLSVGKYGVVIQAADGAGVFYAVQLLRQLLLSGAEQIQTERTQKEQIQTQQTIAASSAKTLDIPPVELEDYPSPLQAPFLVRSGYFLISILQPWSSVRCQ